MKECVCVFVYVTDRWMGLWVYLCLLSFIFPLLFDLTCYLLPPPLCCNSHVSSVPNASANIWVNFCRCHWDGCVCTLRTVMLASQTLTFYRASGKIHRVHWCGLGNSGHELHHVQIEGKTNKYRSLCMWMQMNIHALQYINIIVDQNRLWKYDVLLKTDSKINDN